MMANFYDKWLGFWDESLQEKRLARVVIHEEELEWLETPQDFRVTLMASPETGFHTWGSESMIAEIPAGCHTGKHEHGEEGIYILEGEGYSMVSGEKVPWKKGSLLHVQSPQTPHQHFNSGNVPTKMLRFAPGIRFNFMQRIAKERFPYLWYSHRGANR